MVNPPPVRDHDPLFDDAWLKFAWALKRSETLHAELGRIQDLQTKTGGSFETIQKFDAKTKRFTVVVTSVDPFPAHCSLLLGEVLHGYRSALDNAAWASVLRAARLGQKRGNKRARAAIADAEAVKRIAFPAPVFYSAKYPNARLRFARTKLPNNAPGCTRADLAVMRWAQRFDLVEASRASLPFAILTEKNNLDKHKALQPVLISNRGYFAQQVTCGNCEVKSVKAAPSGTALQVGTKLVTVRVGNIVGDPDIEVQGYLASEPFITEKLALIPFLNALRRFMVHVLSGFSDCPSDIAQRLE